MAMRQDFTGTALWVEIYKTGTIFKQELFLSSIPDIIGALLQSNPPQASTRMEIS